MHAGVLRWLLKRHNIPLIVNDKPITIAPERVLERRTITISTRARALLKEEVDRRNNELNSGRWSMTRLIDELVIQYFGGFNKTIGKLQLRR